jgi:pilus assembly protein CpaC
LNNLQEKRLVKKFSVCVFASVCLFTVFLSNLFALQASDDITLMMGEIKVMFVEAVERIAVGNPAVIDVAVLNDYELVVSAKGVGRTNLIIWDKQGQKQYSVLVKEVDLKKLSGQVESLLEEAGFGNLTTMIEADKVYLFGEVSSEAELGKVKDTLSGFTSLVNLVKIKERQPLIQISVEVLEIGHTDLESLGFAWKTSMLYSEDASTQRLKVPNIFKWFNWNRELFSVTINTLLQEGRAKLLASPNLVTVSGKEANFVVGGEVPVVTVSQGIFGGGVNTEYKTYGVNLTVKPTLMKSQEIRAELKMEVSEIDWDNAVVVSGISIPGMLKRSASTEIYFSPGQTILLAGLMKNEESKNIDRLPFLSRVPVFGELFKSKDFRASQTELVISLTPMVVSADIPDEAPAAPLQTSREMETRMPESQRKPRSWMITEKGTARSGLYLDEAEQQYVQTIQTKVSNAARYPLDAWDRGLEGLVDLEIKVSSDGVLEDAVVVKSSGYPTLDEAALNSVKSCAPFGEFPKEMRKKTLWIEVPVVFKIR